MSNFREIEKPNLRTTDKRNTYKPMQFEWAFEAFEIQNKIHWVPTEIDLLSDLHEFNYTLTDLERHIITQVLRFFTQTDMEIARAYIDYYLPIFQCPEIRMMLSSFAAMEATHMNGYAYLNTSLRLPDREYSAFLQYKEMVDKYDYMQSFKQDDPQGIALTLAIVSGFVEGMTLFASFAILMYPSVLRGQFSKSCLHGVGQIVSYSIRDETLHCFSMIKLFHQYVKENIKHINYEALVEDIYQHAEKALNLEVAFLDLIFENGELEYVSKKDLTLYITYMADLRLGQLGLEKRYGIESNPTPWTDTFLYFKELANFFETTPTSYAKGDFFSNADIDWGNYDNEKIVKEGSAIEDEDEDG